MRKLLFAREPSLGLRLLFFVMISIGLMLVESHTSSLLRVRSILDSLLSPLQYTVHLPNRLWLYTQSSWVSRHTLSLENSLLREKALFLEAQIQKLQALEHENSELRALLQTAPKVGEKILAAHLLSVTATHFGQQFIIDKGSREHVVVGQPVVDAHGLMGQVIEVSGMTSRVMLITDSHSAVPVQVNRNGIRGLVSGNNDQSVLSLAHVMPESDIREGDLLVTSGLEQRFPVGYPVGVVRRVVRDKKQSFLSIEVTPSAALNSSQEVLLVWIKKAG